MKTCRKLTDERMWSEGEIYECETCGNHVCKECAIIWRCVCPHCFGRLYRIS
ncbi:MAG: hypothetical protein K2N47_02790 [Clostridia bacterium]|nr:hypothetical protein [Clostridia bacterium]